MALRNVWLWAPATLVVFAAGVVAIRGSGDGGAAWATPFGGGYGGFDAPSGAVVRTKALEGLYAEEIRGRDRTYRAVTQERQLMIRELVDLAAEEVEPTGRTAWGEGVPEYSFHHRKHLAMLLLGELRAPEGVPVLLDNLHYWAPRSWFEGSAGGHTFRPAADSLARIGKPAVGPTVNRLATTDDEVERELCCWIVRQVEGEQLAPMVLQLAIEREQYSGRKKRLQAALDYLQKEPTPPEQ